MNNQLIANQEEAASIAAEFLSSLDNLPHEVQHLLAEIRHKDSRAQELQQEMQKEKTRYIRHALKGSAAAKDATKENGKEKDTKDRDALIPARVAALHAELETLSKEKIALADRLVARMTRVTARLDHDLAKVLVLSGEQPTEQYEVRGGYVVGVTPIPSSAAAGAGLSAAGAGIGGRNTAMERVSESLRAAASGDLAIGSPSGASTPTSAAGQGPPKRRRITAGGSGVGTANLSTSRAHTPQARSRLGQQVHPSPPRGRRAASAVEDEDAEGEDASEADGKGEADDSGDPDDQEVYCFCRKLSYGEMVGCDNASCKYQWFHLDCVGLKPPLPDSWYCADCEKKEFGGGASARKGRRRQ